MTCAIFIGAYLTADINWAVLENLTNHACPIQCGPFSPPAKRPTIPTELYRTKQLLRLTDNFLASLLHEALANNVNTDEKIADRHELIEQVCIE